MQIHQGCERRNRNIKMKLLGVDEAAAICKGERGRRIVKGRQNEGLDKVNGTKQERRKEDFLTKRHKKIAAP